MSMFFVFFERLAIQSTSRDEGSTAGGPHQLHSPDFGQSDGILEIAECIYHELLQRTLGWSSSEWSRAKTSNSTVPGKAFSLLCLAAVPSSEQTLS